MIAGAETQGSRDGAPGAGGIEFVTGAEAVADDRLVNLRSGEHSEADGSGRRHVVLEAYGYQ